ncbi:caspase-8 [Anastrepha obliqua]|uniref:caspase-8 n=1 Tax=Anastrepha obliqua TaxID=95512 RepID=UPI0024090C33|nr:caspase-8 [Anastrepha obliqua]XP_054727179.1 caspase-8 [Anastrepha obliqua]XP_054727180.1 caspase-8 [Anastrepha obliqua]XP_054727181.1 caspase-8 [Anastrepha obliqua]
MASEGCKRFNLVSKLNNIHVEDLQYVEKDLCFYELVSLGFLLFGDDRVNAEFALQKLLILSNTHKGGGCGGADLLTKYISVNPRNWRAQLVEALAIIGARRVLRRMGFDWNELHQHYLPHIGELSLHVHPLLKALYRVCERLKPAQAGQLVLRVNEQRKRPEELLRFYDFAYLEIFMLDWISRRIITLGDRVANGADVDVLLEFFKFSDLDALKTLLIETIMNNADKQCISNIAHISADNMEAATENNNMSIPAKTSTSVQAYANDCSSVRSCDLTMNEKYEVRRESAGILLIINQLIFQRDPDPKLKHLLPEKPLKPRHGSDVDKERLKNVFTDFGYRAQEFENLTHIELMHRIRETVKLSFQFDSLIVCILSHGIDGSVYGSNSIPVEIAEIEHIITGEALFGKPKLLIIQACQKDESPINEKRKTNVAPHRFGDMVKAMSTVPGYAAMRHTVDGTWFVQELCNAVERFGDRRHIVDILIAVNRKVSERRGNENEVMMPISSNTLRKFFYLPRRN